MTSTLIIICCLLLIAYLFDLSSGLTKIPSVILLLLLGWGVRQITNYFSVPVPNLSSILPALGTIGLILIVLDGSLELTLNKSALPLIKKSFLGALFSMIAVAFLIAWGVYLFGGGSFKTSLLNVIPLCVISSAIAIPSVAHLSSENKEFIIYESALSDIFGVLFFNFIELNKTINGGSFLQFGWQLLAMIAISLIATVLLSFFLKKIRHHIKFAPIILQLIIIYLLAKTFHLPALLFVLIFGLLLGNIHQLARFSWIRKFIEGNFEQEIQKFKELNIEATFVVRVLFFVLFGYLMETAEILNLHTLLSAIGIAAVIYGIRFLQLKISKLAIKPLLFLAPRGLITILLFLSISPAQQIPFINRSLVIQVILIMALTMMIGLMTTKQKINAAPDNLL
jgi:Kef-type K+ transport system membrane component KefB